MNETTQNTLNELWGQWAKKQPRNITRLLYMDAKNQFKDLEVALPPSLVDKLNVVFGWPEKAVYELANRIVLEGIDSPDDEPDPFGLGPVLRKNKFWTELPSAIVSATALSTSFASVTEGDVSRGEPEQLIMFHSALFATGLWDRRLRQMTAGLLINDTDALGQPTLITLMLPEATYVCRDNGGGWFVDADIPNRTKRLMFHRLANRPNLDRPFGKSRIDRVTMSLTDRAVRAGARFDVHSELFATLKLMLMGVGKNTFLDENGQTIPLWSFVMGRMNGIPKDEDHETPKLEVIKAQSPEPHIAGLRELASEFSSHSGVPLSSLGVSSANAESADSKRVGREDVVNDAESQHLIYGDEVLSICEDVVMLRDGLTEPPEEMMGLSLSWRSPERFTKAAIADAGAKQVAMVDGLAGTEVGMEMLGMTKAQIVRAQSQLKRARSSDLLDRVLASKRSEATPDPVVVTDGSSE
ncbi:hypothetical protein U6G28_08830 [Actinomycetaceae bacterium MB13-C1-2]|nr:hypothetical protein U6G28_08830 [Actinomycetaceae bacterium MB13-C1-2]